MAKSLNISISQFIRDAISNQLNTKDNNDMQHFFDNMEPLESFANINATNYIQNIRSKSRIIDE